MEPEVTIEKDTLVIRLPLNKKNPPVSASGKSRVVASTRGNLKTNVEVLGKPVTIGVNAYIGM